VRKPSVLLSALLVLLPVPLMADTISTFTLTNVTFVSGGVATGNIVIDTTTGTVESFDATYTTGGFVDQFDTLSFSSDEQQGVAAVGDFDVSGGDLDFNFLTPSLIGYTGGAVCSETNQCLGFIMGGYVTYGGYNTDFMKTGSLDLPPSDTTGLTPEPSSPILFGTGALFLVGLAGRSIADAAL
jgi:hypothetical protein